MYLLLRPSGSIICGWIIHLKHLLPVLTFYLFHRITDEGFEGRHNLFLFHEKIGFRNFIFFHWELLFNFICFIQKKWRLLLLVLYIDKLIFAVTLGILLLLNLGGTLFLVVICDDDRMIIVDPLRIIFYAIIFLFAIVI